ncbi:MAG: RNA recognition motif domain-containing protein [Flavisolibacter sp.]
MIIQLTNLHLNILETDLQRLFVPFGEIRSLKVLRDKLNNRSRGKAYVDMPVLKQAEKAIVSLHGTILAGKSMVVTPLSGTDENEKVATIL